LIWRRYLGKYAKEDGVEWTLTHAFFANIRGFSVSVRANSHIYINETVESALVRINGDLARQGRPLLRMDELLQMWGQKRDRIYIKPSWDEDSLWEAKVCI
jgi:hypothetical protein